MSNKIKLVVTDMDGTLLTNSKERISKRNLEAIHKLIDHNVTFAIASGRDHDGVYEVLNLFGIHCEAILGNGAQYEDINGNLIKECYMDHSILNDVFQVFESRNIPFMIFTKEGFYTTYKDHYVRDQFIKRCKYRFGNTDDMYEDNGRFANSPCMQLQYIEDKEAFINSDIHVIKVEAFYYDESVMIAPRKDLKNIDHIAYLSSFIDNIEVTAPNAQKGLILEEVCKLKGLDKNEVAVMGDGMNDITLFEKFKYSFAPDNAVEDIKALAYNVSRKNCDEDSFAEQVDLILSL